MGKEIFPDAELIFLRSFPIFGIVEFAVPAAVAVGGGVCDALAVCCPENHVALTLHQLQELLSGDGVLHGFIDLYGKAVLSSSDLWQRPGTSTL